MSKRKNEEVDMHVSRDEVYLQLPQQKINIRCGIQKKLPDLLDPGFDDAELLLHFLSVPQLLSRLSPLGPGLCQEAEDEETHPGFAHMLTNRYTQLFSNFSNTFLKLFYDFSKTFINFSMTLLLLFHNFFMTFKHISMTMY